MDITTLTDAWIRLWNNDLTVADTIVAPDFVAHAAPLTGGSDEIHGRDGLTEWIAGSHSTIKELTFAVEIGPLVDRDYVVLRWRATGVGVNFTGTDILLLKDGVIVEYWLNADSLQLAQQLGLVPQG